MAERSLAENINNTISYLGDMKQVLENKDINMTNIPVSEYADKIDILTNSSDANATADDILKPRTAYVNGEKITGAINIVEQNVSQPIPYNTLVSVPNGTINNTGIAVAPDGTVVTISGSTIRVFPFGSNNYISYALSSFGISNTQNMKIDINQSINEYGAYLVIFESDYSRASSGTAYIACTYLKEGQLGYIHNSEQAHHISWTESCNWWNTALCHSNTKPQTFFVPTRDNTRVCTVSLDLKTHTTKSIGISVGRCLSAQITSDDHFLAVNCENSWDGTQQALARLDEDFNLLSVQKYTCNSDIILLHKDGENYCIMRDYFYHLIESESSSSFSMVQQAGRITNLLDNGSNSTSSRASYKYGMFNNTNILAVSGGTSGQIVFFSYTINTSHQISVTRLENFSYPGGDTRRMYPYNQYMVYVLNTTQVGFYRIIQSGDTIPITITRQDTTLYNTYDADAVAANILNTKVAYNKSGKVTGTMPNNGQLNYTPSESAQTIPAGYTSGGTISAFDWTTATEYQTCLALTNEILE